MRQARLPRVIAREGASDPTLEGGSSVKLQKPSPLSWVTGRFRRPSFCKLGAREFPAKKRVINDPPASKKVVASLRLSPCLFRRDRASSLGLPGLVIDSGLLVADKKHDHREIALDIASRCNLYAFPVTHRNYSTPDTPLLCVFLPLYSVLCGDYLESRCNF